MSFGKRFAAGACAATIVIGIAAQPAAGGPGDSTGRIVSEKRVTLGFPASGVYEGAVRARKPRVSLPAAQDREQASNAENRKAKRKAARFCRRQVTRKPVSVYHDPDEAPRVLIGSDVPDAGGSYSVTGFAVPPEDAVSAVQGRSRKPITVNGFRWQVICSRGVGADLAPGDAAPAP